MKELLCNVELIQILLIYVNLNLLDWYILFIFKNYSLTSMIPIRVISTWSKVLEITYITFANTISLPDT
jgi:hypothetical protein